jgi:hypothetical protein
MTTTAGVHVATVRQYIPATGVATVVIPALYGDKPIEARPFLSSPAELGNLPSLSPGDTVIAFYDGGDPMTILRWYLAGAGISEGGTGVEEVWVGPTPPTGAYEIWVDTSS